MFILLLLFKYFCRNYTVLANIIAQNVSVVIC